MSLKLEALLTLFLIVDVILKMTSKVFYEVPAGVAEWSVMTRSALRVRGCLPRLQWCGTFGLVGDRRLTLVLAIAFFVSLT